MLNLLGVSNVSQIMPAIWLILAITLTLLEVFTYQLVAVWFAIGAVIGLVSSLFNVEIWVQLIIFALTSFLCLLATRPLVRKVFRVDRVHTNSDRIIGECGIVICKITPEQKGRIYIDGLDWSAAALNGDTIEEGSKIIVRKITGVTAMVEKAETMVNIQ